MKTRNFTFSHRSSGSVAHEGPIAKPIAVTQGSLFLGCLLIIDFFFLPMYVFGSGGFQLVDIPILITSLVVLFKLEIPDDFDRKLIFALLPFILWVFVINFVYYALYKHTWELISFVAIAYGFIQLFVFSLLFFKMLNEKTIKYIYIALIFSVIGCFAIKGFNDEGRAALSFNNVNQLAYFAAILLCYVIMLMQYKVNNGIKNRIYIVFDIMLIIMAHFFTLIAFSRAGVVIIIALDICLILNIRNIRYIFPTIIGVGIAVLIFILTNPEFIQQRLAMRSHSQFTAEGMMHKDGVISRAIRPLRYLQGLNFLYGIGPAGHTRAKVKQGPSLTREGHDIEVHNSFGDILRSYGLIGLLLFFYWYLGFVWKARLIKNGLWIMAAIFLWNNAHLGIRFRSFWIFMAFFAVLICLEQRKLAANISTTNHVQTKNQSKLLPGNKNKFSINA